MVTLKIEQKDYNRIYFEFETLTEAAAFAEKAAENCSIETTFKIIHTACEGAGDNDEAV